MTIKPGCWNFTINIGGTFNYTITWTDNNSNPINLTGYSAKMMIRESLDAPTPLATLTTDDATIVLGGAAGTIKLNLPNTSTAALPSVTGVYDLEITSPSGEVDFLLQGEMTIKKMVTV